MALNESTSRLARRLDGLLYFPVTAFGADGSVDLDAYRQHLKSRLSYRPAAVFACCGTGEFFSLRVEEYTACLRVAVEEAAGQVPVIAGVGYGTAMAIEFGRAASAAGVDGLLLMPPYLVEGSAAGLREHYRQVADSVDLE